MIWYILNIILIIYGIGLFIYGKCFTHKINHDYVKIFYVAYNIGKII